MVAEFGRCDILVNNAGGSFASGKLADSDPAQWTKTVDINLYGTYYLIRALLADIPRGGKIINIASGMGLAALPGDSSYAAAKAAVHMLTQVLSQEVWERGIDVNDVIPGLVATTQRDLGQRPFLSGIGHGRIRRENAAVRAIGARKTPRRTWRISRLDGQSAPGRPDRTVLFAGPTTVLSNLPETACQQPHPGPNPPRLGV